ncbi:MAG: glycosyltransferase [Chitinophagaceae bacterium]|jgi:glycosyltransferase involved in cell wall biosynthesis|nr:glycosyltransferase [Pyrinomonadaceae bacterium]MCU0323017.1 glycosyltransferase [Chitinophagaceae bacterium]
MLDSNKPISIYLSHLGVTENLTQTQVIPYLAGLAKTFQQPIILLTHEKAVMNRKVRTKIREPLLQKGIIWESVQYHQGRFLSAKLRDLYYSFAKVKEILQHYTSLNIIHVRSYFHTPVALYFRYLSSFNLKFVWDIRGFYLDEYVEMNLGRKGIFYYFLKRFEKFVFSKCDALVVLTNQTINALKELNYSFPDNFAVIPTSISEENFSLDDFLITTNQTFSVSLEKYNEPQKLDS